MKKLVWFSKNRSAAAPELRAPSSKSALQRIIALTWLSQAETKIINPSVTCNDVNAALGIIKALGAEVKETASAIYIDSRGKAGGLNERRSKVKLFCGESALALRMFAPIAALYPCSFEFEAAGTLSRRPTGFIANTLSAFGIQASDNAGFPPLAVRGHGFAGSSASVFADSRSTGEFADSACFAPALQCRGAACSAPRHYVCAAEIDGSLSSQVLTGLLFALLTLKKDSEIKVNNLKSKPYIDLTIDLAEKFNCEIENIDYNLFKIRGGQKYKSPGTIEPEGDWSSAAFLLVAAALSKEGFIEIDNLDINSKQADKAIVGVLSSCGLKIESKCKTGNNSVFLKRVNSILQAFEFDASDCPDLFPSLVALASGCSGTSIIHGAERLKHKESNRELALVEEFSKAGIEIKSDGRTISVAGSEKGIRSFKGSSHNDHRIAMALAAAAAAGEAQVEIENTEAVDKSYPNFFNDLMLLGGQNE
ncbi:MAG: 3-phosphoshikimate 1-carboxyvinyltransferase [Spirochaetes bacterium]|nr:3-phosphoshikimate 1-carboxyvinyltransferase [Spirochaetota bacterium]